MNTGTSGITIIRTSDLNSAYPKNYGVGFFSASYQALNVPTGTWGFIIAFRAENSYVSQLWLNMTGSSGQIYSRNGMISSGTWGDWVLVN